MRITAKSLIVAVVKTGQLVGPFFLFVTFVSMFLYGKMVWVEPNMAVLIFEIGLSFLWLVGSAFDLFLPRVKKMLSEIE